MSARAKPTSHPYTAIARTMIHKICDATDFCGADRQHAVRLFARLVPDDLDLGDERHVVQFLVNYRCSTREAFDLAEDVADAVREMRQRAVLR